VPSFYWGTKLLKGLNEIEETLGRQRDLYKSVDLKIAALKVDGKWYNRRTSALFSPEIVSNEVARIVEVEDFAVFSNLADVRSVWGDLLDVATNGQFVCDGETIHFTNIDDKRSANVVYDYYYSRSSRKSVEFGIDWPADFFKCEWHLNERGIQRIADNQIRCHNPPYEDVREAIHSTVHACKDLCSSGSILWWIFPTYLGIETCSLDGDDLEVAIEFHEAIDLGRVRASLVGRGPEIRREQVQFREEPVMTNHTSILRARAETLLENVSSVQTYLFLDSDRPPLPIDECETRNRRSRINERIAAHGLFDVGCERILDYLQSEQLRESGRFEWVVATILHFSGFHTEWIGGGGLGEVPDVLAFYPDEDTLIVGECTVGVPDENKIMKLRDRAESLRLLNKQIRAIMFCRAERRMIETVAMPLEITVVDGEQIREMFDMASRGIPTQQIFSYMIERHFRPS